jgi:hypothetical protein
MPILPIDLQTMFSNLNQVSREQSIQKDVTPAQQALQSTQVVKETEAKDKTVNETREVGDGINKVSEEEKKKKTREKRKKGGKKQTDQNNLDSNEVVKDPLLGHHVDLIG